MANEGYEPASDFLKSIIADEIPLSGSVFGDANLARLIALTQDDDRSNRDWATTLLSMEPIDNEAVRSALLAAALDDHNVIRDEAILGLARRDKVLALPYLQAALQSRRASMALFEAAGVLAEPSLVEFLLDWLDPSDDDFLDGLAQQAFTACKSGIPTE